MLSSATTRDFSSSQPYIIPTRKERSRELAQKRRTTYKSLMKDLADELPFSKDVVSQVDYNSRLRLALCFVRMKKLLEQDKNEDEAIQKPVQKGNMGVFQDLLVESLDGFLMTIMGDGTILHVSETIHKHLGLFQSEHIGFSFYDLIHEEDHHEVKQSLSQAESQALAGLSDQGSIGCSFFCRMKCSKSKLSNSATKSPGYKLVYVSGQYKLQENNSFLTAIVHPVSPPSILEIRMEGNMFVTHYALDMRCTFFDGRLRHLMGFEKEDLIGHVPFEHHHHNDVAASLECSKGLMTRGEGLSGYYRFMNKFGIYVWMQSRGIMMFDSRSGRPSYIVCMNYVISKEVGDRDLELRKAITSGQNQSSIIESARSYDPFPTPRGDMISVNPLEEPETYIRKPSSPSNDDLIITSTSSSPPESRASPDIPTPISTFGDNFSYGDSVHKLTSSEGDDFGYGSSVSHSYHSSVISPQSVTSSLYSDEAGSYNNSVFQGSPHSQQSPDPINNKDAFSIASKHKELTALLSTSCTNSPQSVDSINTSTAPAMHTPNSSVGAIPPQGFYQREYETVTVNPEFMAQRQFVSPNSVCFSAGGNFMQQAPPFNQFGFQFNGMNVFCPPPDVGFSATVLPLGNESSSNLPVLSVEDVQFINSRQVKSQFNPSVN